MFLKRMPLKYVMSMAGSDIAMNQFQVVTDAEYIYGETANGSQGKVAKNQLENIIRKGDVYRIRRENPLNITLSLGYWYLIMDNADTDIAVIGVFQKKIEFLHQPWWIPSSINVVFVSEGVVKITVISYDDERVFRLVKL